LQRDGKLRRRSQVVEGAVLVGLGVSTLAVPHRGST
jgi:hypothetical protein